MMNEKEVHKIVNFAMIFFLIIGFLLGLISGYGIGQQLQFNYDAEQIKEVSNTEKYFKTDLGYFKIYNTTEEFVNRNNLSYFKIGD